MRIFVCLAILGMVSGCATIIEGTSQSVMITSDPAGASCNLDRQGLRLGQVSPTPGSVHIDKSKNDISVACNREGYQPAVVTQSPKFVGTTFGNIVAGGLIGVVVDASTGANYEYPNEIRVPLAPVVVAASPGPVGAPLSMTVSTASVSNQTK